MKERRGVSVVSFQGFFLFLLLLVKMYQISHLLLKRSDGGDVS